MRRLMPVATRTIFLAALAVVCLASCGKVETTTLVSDDELDERGTQPVLDSTRHVVWGAVSKKGTAEYLQGVSVAASGTSTTTDAAGSYVIYLAAGAQTLEFSKDGYQSESKDASGSAGVSTEVNVALLSNDDTGSSGGSGSSGSSSSGSSSSGSESEGSSSGGSGACGDGYVITKDQRVERWLSVPCSLEYTICGKDPAVEDGSSRDNTHLMWAYEQAWGGGNTTAGGGMVAGVRDYAVKVYNHDGSYAGMKRYSGTWNPDRSYRVKMTITSSQVSFSIDGSEVATVAATAPSAIMVGYGWPPSVRPGAEGAVITDVVWSE